jgi:hypothetical protein
VGVSACNNGAGEIPARLKAKAHEVRHGARVPAPGRHVERGPSTIVVPSVDERAAAPTTGRALAPIAQVLVGQPAGLHDPPHLRQRTKGARHVQLVEELLRPLFPPFLGILFRIGR